MLDGERLSGNEKLMDDLAMLGLEPSTLRRGEPLVRNEKIADVLKGVPHETELLFETTAKGGDIVRGAIRRPHRIERSRQ
jgi:hypothetical protein